MIDTLFINFLKISFITSVSFVPVLMIASVIRRRYSAKCLYFTWLFMAIRLLIPSAFGLLTPQIQLDIPMPV